MKGDKYMSVEYENFISNIKHCLDLCNKKLLYLKNGGIDECTIEQLTETIIPELEYILKNIDECNLPPHNKRYLISFAYAFKDWAWNMNDPSELYIQLANLNNEYNNLS